MALPTPAPGLVISYAYLWRDQAAAGAEEGRKSRPCAIVLTALDEEGDTVTYVAPITHAAPKDDDTAVALPAGVRRRLGVDAAASWIITRELNRFVWVGYDLRPVSRLSRATRPTSSRGAVCPSRMQLPQLEQPLSAGVGGACPAEDAARRALRAGERRLAEPLTGLRPGG